MRIALMASCLACITLQAHEVRPAYLEINALDDLQYHVIWKQPLTGNQGVALAPVFPDDCAASQESIETARGESLIRHFRLTCTATLVERTVKIDGLPRTLTDVLVRARLSDDLELTVLLRPESPEFQLTGGQSAPVLSYLSLGVDHLLFGIDHILFVVGLMFFVSRVGALVRTITAFTVAHSITLGVSALGIVSVPQPPVEAVIALSIMFLAVEKLRGQTDTLTHRHTWLVALVFGLLHGFGFAGALADIGLPRDNVLAALFLFNVGVEIGQLIVVAIALVAVRLVKTMRIDPPVWLRHAPLYAIGSVGAFWLVDRTAAMLL